MGSQPAKQQLPQLCKHLSKWRPSQVVVTVFLQNLSTLPHTLANICTAMVLNGSVCQGFTLNTTSKLAFFQGQTPQQAIDLTAASQAASDTSLWLIDAGQL